MVYNACHVVSVLYPIINNIIVLKKYLVVVPRKYDKLINSFKNYDNTQYYCRITTKRNLIVNESKSVPYLVV